MSAFIVPGAATWRSCCGALCATCATLIVAILIGSSFHELTPVQMGLDYDGLAHRVNDKILYENGRWFLGPAHSFIVFPRTTRSILMRNAEADSGVISDQQFSSLTARTSDGLAVEMELSYQYRLEASAESLGSLYRDFGLDYEVAYIRESRDVLRTSASRFSAFEYFYNRSSVASAMQQELTDALSTWHANVEAFQLLTYQLPAAFSRSIEDMEVARQEVEMTQLQLSVASIDATTRLLSSKYQAERRLLTALTAANATLLAGAAQSEAVALQLEAEAASLLQARDALRIEDDNELLAATWLLGVRRRQKQSPTQMLVQMTPPKVLGRTPAR